MVPPASGETGDPAGGEEGESGGVGYSGDGEDGGEYGAPGIGLGCEAGCLD